jgi:3'-phosphoadenosine 5'-phosphosulfate sulfotransferase (PAPS reductase)/FAD synthetase
MSTTIQVNVFAQLPPPGLPWGWNFGGGVNSTAGLLFCYDMGLRPDFVLFADTGSERPETYANVERVHAWCKKVGFPFSIVRWVRKDGIFEPLHVNCLRTEYLPSKAYGYAGCTAKWKVQPMQRWRKKHGFVPAVVAIGYDIGEKRRVSKAEKLAVKVTADSDEVPWYPLLAWKKDRAACINRIHEEGWPTAKSACFMCPSSKPAEWQDLAKRYPTLYQTAVAIENHAKAAGHADSKGLFNAYANSDGTCMCKADGYDDDCENQE